MTLIEQDGPMRIEQLAGFYQASCTDCHWSGPLRNHRIDAEEDFDDHQH